MDAGRATSRVESCRSSRARPPPMCPVFGSGRFGSFRSFVRGTSSRSFATKSAGGVWDVVVCDSPLRTRAYGMVGVGRSSCLNAMEKEKVHIGRSNGYRRVASRARALMC